MTFSEELAHVRKISQELGRFSWTSDQYQEDLLEFIIRNKDKGHGIIEVGTYKGGLTAQLALLCSKFGWRLWSMDLIQEFLDTAADLLCRLDLIEHVDLFLGPLDHFASAVSLTEKPVVVVLDGDHEYEAVKRDIQSVYRLTVLPYGAAFHDYSLRHPTTGERVSDAIKDSFGDCPVRLIGAQMDGAGPYPTKERPTEDGHWWEVPGSEGALIELPARLAHGR